MTKYNVSILKYYYESLVKYRSGVFDNKTDGILKEAYQEIAKRYDIEFRGIGKG